MKCIRKDMRIEGNLDQLKDEINRINEMNNHFIIGTDYIFSDKIRLYFFVEFIQGGIPDMLRQMARVKRFTND